MSESTPNEPWYASEAERVRAEAAARSRALWRKLFFGAILVIGLAALLFLAVQHFPKFERHVTQVPVAPSFAFVIETDLDGDGTTDCVAINLSQKPTPTPVGFLRKNDPSMHREFRRVLPSPTDPLLYRDELAKIKTLAAQFPPPPATLPPDTDTSAIIHVIRADLDGDGELDFIVFTEASRDAHTFVLLKRDGRFVTYESLLSAGALTTRQVAAIDENQYNIVKSLPPNTLPPPRPRK